MFRRLKNLIRESKPQRPAAGPTVKVPPLCILERAHTTRRAAGVPDPGCLLFIPFAVIQETVQVMQRFGREKRECYVWWGGYRQPGQSSAQIVTTIYPDVDTEYGRIHLAQQDLSVLQERLRKLDQVLLVELHTHPPMAGGQNEVDAAHPAAPYSGFISVVVPDFGFVNLADLRDSHVYEYIAENRWRTLDRLEIAERFVVDPTAVRVSRHD